MEKKYMRDFSLILEIDQPMQMVEYETFVQMVKSKVTRLNTKIDLLTYQREPHSSSDGLTKHYMKEAEHIK